MSRGGRSSAKAMPSDAHGPSHITSTLSFYLCVDETKSVPLLLGRRQNHLHYPLKRSSTCYCPSLPLTFQLCRQSREELKSCSRAGSPFTYSQAGKQMPHSQRTSGTSAVSRSCNPDILSQLCCLLPHTPVMNIMTLNSSESVLPT